MASKNSKSSRHRGFQPIVVGAFLVIGVLISFDEILDLPHLLFGTPAIPFSWMRIGLEVGLIFLIGFSCVVLLSLSESRRRRVEADLRRSEERFSQVANSCGEWIWETDAAGRFLYSSSAVKDILGYGPEEMPGKHLCDLFHPDDRESLEVRISEIFRKREPMVKLTNCKSHKGGHPVILETSASPLVGERGELLGYRGADRDITQQKKSQEALDLRAHQLELLREIAPLLIAESDLGHALQLVADASRTLVSAKLGMAGLFGEEKPPRLSSIAYSMDPNLATLCNLRIPKSGEAIYKAIFDSRAESIRVSNLTSHPCSQGLPEGHPPLRGLVGIPMVGKAGEVLGVFMASDKEDHSDFSEEDQRVLEALGGYASASVERIKAQNCVRQATLNLERANQEMQSFIYSISHDLRMPLVAVQGFAELLRGEYGDMLKGEAQRYLVAITESTHKMGALVEDLLQLSRVGRMDTEPEEVASESLLEDITTELRVKAQNRNLDFRIKGPLPKAYCNRKRLYQVFSNLLDNAVKSTQGMPQAKIEVGFRELGNKKEFYIQDNGPGIDPQYHEEIFRVFRRLRAGEYEGSGMGLTFVKKIVESWGGDIRVESEPGKGATFYFSLPEAGELKSINS